jgi:hypothetical protein
VLYRYLGGENNSPPLIAQPPRCDIAPKCFAARQPLHASPLRRSPSRSSRSRRGCASRCLALPLPCRELACLTTPPSPSPPPLPLFPYLDQLQQLQHYAHRDDIAAAIESAKGTLQVRLRLQQLDVWSHATAAADAEDHMVCALCLDQLYRPHKTNPTALATRCSSTVTPPPTPAPCLFPFTRCSQCHPAEHVALGQRLSAPQLQPARHRTPFSPPAPAPACSMCSSTRHAVRALVAAAAAGDVPALQVPAHRIALVSFVRR